MFTLLLLMILVTFQACKKDTDIFVPNPHNPQVDLGALVTHEVFGVIRDDAGKPVKDAKVTGGGKTTYTDAHGVFVLQGASLYTRRAYIQVEKQGYFEGSRAFVVGKTKRSYVEVDLLKKNLSGSFSTANGGVIESADGVRVSFEAGALVDQNGNAYEGTVRVYARHINAATEALYRQMPGNLWGINTQGNEIVMQTYGMAAVTLEGTGGQKLNLASGQEAVVFFPLSAALHSHAPAEIPLWHFDQKEGIWKEEGSAQLSAQGYEGKVTHFSFWNVDAPFPLIDWTARFINQDGVPLSNYFVVLERQGQTGVAYAGTGTDGVVQGKIPANEVLTLKITDRCGTILYTSQIGPFASDTDSGDITVNTAPSAEIQVSGRLVDCGGSPLSEGYALLSNSFFYVVIPVEPDGTFDAQILNCSNSGIQIRGVHPPTAKESVIYSHHPTAPVIHAGDIEVCNDLEEYIIFEIDGGTSYVCEQVVYEDPNPGGMTYIYLIGMPLDSMGQTLISISGEINGVGTYQFSGARSLWINAGFREIENVDMTFIVSEYDQTPGTYWRGSFSGTFDATIDQNPPVQKTISGTFSVRRR